MPIPAVVDSQIDFSAGEVDVTIKRGDGSEQFKKGLRTCANFRILDTKKLSNRLGRTYLFTDGPRVDKILMSPGNLFYLIFGNGYLRIRNAAGTQVFNSTKKGDGTTNIPWTTTTAAAVVWDIYSLSIYIFYADGAPANVPQILTWDGVSQSSTWTLTTFAEQVINTQKRTPFYRISPLGITLVPSALSGSVGLTFSANVLVAGHVGTRMRYIGKQILITAVANGTTGTATVEETLYGSQILGFTFDMSPYYIIGDVVIGATTGAQAVVIAVNGGAKNISVQYINNIQFSIANERVTGPNGSFIPSTGSGINAPSAVTIWDDEVMNTFRGYPSSGFVDQGRLGLCNFPAVPGGICWSSFGVFTDLYIPPNGVTVSSSIFEIAPGKSQVLYVLPGAESSEFVFCDNAVYYIPIDVNNPLSGTAGVSFQRISGSGCAPVKPQLVEETIVYIPAGRATVAGITTTGATQRPHEAKDLSKNHNHLFNAPVAIAGMTADSPDFPERYIYVVNADGTMAVGQVDIANGELKDVPGWVSESGAGLVKWASSHGADIVLTTTYQPGGATAFTAAEAVDATQYVDCAQLYGGGPVTYLANGTCTVMDLGTRQLDTYSVNGSGFLIPQGTGGENFASSQLVVGQPWTATCEPFIPAPAAGQDVGQRMCRRRIKRAFVYVQNSTGFVFQKLFSGPITPTSPPLGTVMQIDRVLTYNEGDDATQPPPLREGTYFWRPRGRSYDPRHAIVKDTAGPLNILELGFDVTI